MRLLLFLSAAPIWGEQAAELVYYPGTFRPSLDPNAPILWRFSAGLCPAPGPSCAKDGEPV